MPLELLPKPTRQEIEDANPDVKPADPSHPEEDPKPPRAKHLPIEPRSVRFYREMLKIEENWPLPEDLARFHLRIVKLLANHGRLVIGAPEHAFIVALFEELEGFKADIESSLREVVGDAIKDVAAELVPGIVESQVAPAMNKIMSEPPKPEPDAEDLGEGDLSEQISQWDKIPEGTKVTVTVKDKEAAGKFLGLNEDNRLKVRLDGVTRGFRKFDADQVALVTELTPSPEGE